VNGTSLESLIDSAVSQFLNIEKKIGTATLLSMAKKDQDSPIIFYLTKSMPDESKIRNVENSTGRRAAKNRRDYTKPLPRIKSLWTIVCVVPRRFMDWFTVRMEWRKQTLEVFYRETSPLAIGFEFDPSIWHEASDRLHPF
jgi:hypothetical protein